MVSALGWLGLFLLGGVLATLIPRRLSLRGRVGNILIRGHHTLALACAVVLGFHGLWALVGRRGWRWGGRTHFAWDLTTGLIALSLLAAICLLAASVRQKGGSRAHCRLVGPMVIAVLLHLIRS